MVKRNPLGKQGKGTSPPPSSASHPGGKPPSKTRIRCVAPPLAAVAVAAVAIAAVAMLHSAQSYAASAERATQHRDEHPEDAVLRAEALQTQGRYSDAVGVFDGIVEPVLKRGRRAGGGGGCGDPLGCVARA